LKKCRPTTREAAFVASSLAADTPLGMVAAAILVILIELVFEARMASGFSSAANEAKMACFSCTFSDTAFIDLG
jgi:hypothetical protein